ncbi:agmatine deiminase [Amycolatopsis xylanica]|uniref:Agmatine deiminase n=1 Tax=Amycolatopsis xylanica TaxID=589385 RepID=A0A1H3CTU1_9PSEU|nr:agmatine deiminase family protein [Amycolatopsis xylanica]SDX57563.1 agmatine deiminase [Amycolatopsis xylanica]
MSERDELPSAAAPKPLGRRSFLSAVGLAGAGVALGAFPAVAAPRRAAGFWAPEESVAHTRTWMAWPDRTSIWGSRLLPGVQANIALIARTIAKYEPVYLLANSRSAAKARSACGSTVQVISSIPVDDCWMRDTGPVFRVDGAGGLDAVGLNFNGWGNQQSHYYDARVAAGVAAYAGVGFTAAGFVGEPGAVETDGAGTLMATKSSLINANRNSGMSQSAIEAAMCAAYGASKVIWFPGIKGQDITDDHVDATSRFTGHAGAAVQYPLDSDTDIWAKDARGQYQILSQSADTHGHAIAVTRIQGPDYRRIRSTNPDFVSSYANYYVCNGAVIAAQFGDTAADTACKTTLARLYPGRVIEQLNIDSLAEGGGGIHCVTQQQPRP